MRPGQKLLPACLQALVPDHAMPPRLGAADRIPGLRAQSVVACLLSPAVLGMAALSGATAWAQGNAALQTRTLPEVVVSATGNEQALVDAPASISVVPRRALEGRYYRDVSDSLQDIPGVSIEGGAGGKLESTAVTIRGMSENYVLFLVDGKPVGDSSEAYYNGFGGGAIINQLPPASAIERIEVIRGPMSSLYGSSALGGVINIITRKISQRWTGSFTLDGILQEESNAGNSGQGRYFVSGPLISDRLSLAVHGSHFRRSEDRIANGYPDKERTDTTARLNWKLSPAQHLEIEAGYNRNKNLRTAARTGADSDMSNRRPHYGLTHDIDWGDRVRTRSFLTHEEVEVENGDYDSGYQAVQANSKTTIGLANQSITVGADLKEEKTRHMPSRFPGSIDTNLSRWQMALFAEDEYAFTPTLMLTGGLRLDRNEHYGNKVTPRLYAVHHFSPGWTLKGGVSGGYRTPSLKQADNRIVEIAARGAAWDMGNRDLRPESSINHEIGLNWASPSGLNVGATVYHTRFRDRISTEVICNSPAGRPACEYNGEVRRRINQYVNVARATLQGLELSLSAPLGPVGLRAGYTFSDSEITRGPNAGRPLNNQPRHAVSLSTDWQVRDDWNVWSRIKYRSRTLEDGSLRYPGYAMVDLGVRWDINPSLQVFGGVMNLLDKRIELDTYGKSLDGRRVHMGMTVGF